MDDLEFEFRSALSGSCASWLLDRLRATVEDVTAAKGTTGRTLIGHGGEIAVLEACLRRGDVDTAEHLCRTRGQDVQGAIPAFGLILEVIHRIERDWQAEPAPDGPLTFAFWNVQNLLDRLRRPEVPAAAAPRGTVLVALPEGEGHQFGARLVAQELRRQSWNAEADLTASNAALLARVARDWIDVIGLSVGHDGAFADLAHFITDVREASLNRGLRVMIGGAAIVAAPRAYAFLGADCVAGEIATAAAYLDSVRPGRRLQDWN